MIECRMNVGRVQPVNTTGPISSPSEVAIMASSTQWNIDLVKSGVWRLIEFRYPAEIRTLNIQLQVDYTKTRLNLHQHRRDTGTMPLNFFILILASRCLLSMLTSVSPEEPYNSWLKVQLRVQCEFVVKLRIRKSKSWWSKGSDVIKSWEFHKPSGTIKCQRDKLFSKCSETLLEPSVSRPFIFQFRSSYHERNSEKEIVLWATKRDEMKPEKFVFNSFPPLASIDESKIFPSVMLFE